MVIFASILLRPAKPDVLALNISSLMPFNNRNFIPPESPEYLYKNKSGMTIMEIYLLYYYVFY